MQSNRPELMTEAESLNQDLTFDQLKQLYIMHGFSVDPQTFAGDTGLLCKNGKYNVLAEVLSDNNEYSLKVVAYAGTSRFRPLVCKEFGYMCLLLSMQQVLECVNSLNETRVAVNGSLSRKEKHLFDENEFREAWINAVLHTDWVNQVPPEVDLFHDRMEVVSTAILPAEHDLRDFYGDETYVVNAQLQKVMEQLGLLDHKETVAKQGNEVPPLTVSHMKETLDFAFEMFSFKVNTTHAELTSSQEKVFQAIKQHPSIRIVDLGKATGLSTSTVNNALRDLKRLDRIRRFGSRKSGYWEILD